MDQAVRGSRSGAWGTLVGVLELEGQDGEESFARESRTVLRLFRDCTHFSGLQLVAFLKELGLGNMRKWGLYVQFLIDGDDVIICTWLCCRSG